MKPNKRRLLLLSMIACMAVLAACISSCKEPAKNTDAPIPSTVPTTTDQPAVEQPVVRPSFNADAYIPTVRIAATMACGSYLQFGIKEDAIRVKRANKIWAGANGAYALLNGRVPTVPEFENYIRIFGGGDDDLEYAKFSVVLSAVYSDYYTKLVTMEYKEAFKIISAIAEGCQNSASAFMGSPPIASYQILPVPEMSFWLRTPTSPPSVIFNSYVQNTWEGAFGALLV